MNGTPWTEERTAELRRLRVDQNLAIRECAAEMGLTTGQVIGKLQREGLLNQQGPRPPKAPRPPRIRKPKKRLPNRTALAPAAPGHPWHNGEKKAPKALPLDTSPGLPQNESAVDIEGLRSHHCKWIYGDPVGGEFFYCGRVRMEGSSYCRGHFILSVRADCLAAAHKRAKRSPDVPVPDGLSVAVEPSGAAGERPNQQHDDEGTPFDDFASPRVIAGLQIGREPGKHETGRDQQEQQPVGEDGGDRPAGSGWQLGHALRQPDTGDSANHADHEI